MCCVMKDLFKFAPIQTKFDGYHFRSRLEARWAVFFKTLGIPYEYEKEGYSLEGTPYLPDFWLPEQSSFVEIKGQDPTKEELDKAEKLALYTGKEVYVISGNVGFSSSEYIYYVSNFCPPTLHACKKGMIASSTGRKIQTIPAVLSILQRLEEVELYLRLDTRGEWSFERAPFIGSLTTQFIQYYTKDLQQHYDVLQSLTPLLEQYEEDLRAALTVGEDEYPHFESGGQIEELEWGECNACGHITMASSQYSLPHDCNGKGTYTTESPRLMEAYTAARSARFEQGAKS